MGFELAKKSGGADRRPYVCDECGMSTSAAPAWCTAHNPRKTRRNAVQGVRIMKLAAQSGPDDLD